MANSSVILFRGLVAELEEQVRQLQKMELIGQLTGAIAHDFRNILTVILGSGQFLLERFPEGDPARVDAEAIVEAAERGSSLARQLLGFSSRHTPAAKILSLNSIILDMKNILDRLIGDDIELSLTLFEHLGNVCGDPIEIEQVVLNLVINACDAMPRGGRLSIETVNVDLGEEYAFAHGGVARGEYVMLAVSDTGCGMDAETRRRVFEPFFTTKETGHGTGLGLSTCLGIVRQRDGFIWAYSEPGQGSAFKVYLPKVACDREVAPRAAAMNPNIQGTETILVVEDDDRIRALVQRGLASLGYRVLTAANGQEALATCESHAGRIDLVLSDVVLPDICGLEVVKRVQAHQTTVRAVLMSGYTGHALLRDGVIEPGMNFIQKPFARDVLAGKVREVLDA